MESNRPRRPASSSVYTPARVRKSLRAQPSLLGRFIRNPSTKAVAFVSTLSVFLYVNLSYFLSLHKLAREESILLDKIARLEYKRDNGRHIEDDLNLPSLRKPNSQK
eukprot:TRINITY_DN5740_c0_g1_i1.p1 TRINITY_DN5740_c0_g1~~TRINITY_DN5740_c0_g1_i1.p1  ORF type:complete len:107 (+),score=11.00 TRINITY_DN5740_c0_g1_i1:117-437(+)